MKTFNLSEENEKILIRELIEDLRKMRDFHIINPNTDGRAIMVTLAQLCEAIWEAACREHISPNGIEEIPIINRIPASLGLPREFRELGKEIIRGAKYDIFDIVSPEYLENFICLAACFIAKTEKYYIYENRELVDLVEEALWTIKGLKKEILIDSKLTKEVLIPNEEAREKGVLHFLVTGFEDKDTTDEDEDVIDKLYRKSFRNSNSNKAMAPLYIYDILKAGSSPRNHMSQQELQKILKNSPYELDMDRKSIAKHVRALAQTHFGIGIDANNPKAGYWYDKSEDASYSKDL